LDAGTLPPGTLFVEKTQSLKAKIGTTLTNGSGHATLNRTPPFVGEGETHRTMGNCCRQAALADAGKNSRQIRLLSSSPPLPPISRSRLPPMGRPKLVMNVALPFDVQGLCGLCHALAMPTRLLFGQATDVLVIGSADLFKSWKLDDRSTSVCSADGAARSCSRHRTGEGTSDDRGVLSIDLNF